MWQRFSQKARAVVFRAQEEAQRLGNPYVCTEHLLLGILHVEDSAARRVLERLGVSVTEVRSKIEELVQSGRLKSHQDMVLTPKAKRVIDLAYQHFRDLGNKVIGTEHLLLGLIGSKETPAGQALAQCGVELESALAAVVQVQLDGDGSDDPGSLFPHGPFEPPVQPAPAYKKSPGATWQRFTEEARKAVFYAQEEAQRFGHDYVGTEHLLLGVLRDRATIACQALIQTGIDPLHVRAEVERHILKPLVSTSKDTKITPLAKRGIDLAYAHARNLDNHSIGAEHLLLGLLELHEGIASQALEALDAQIDPLIAAVIELQSLSANESRQVASLPPTKMADRLDEGARKVIFFAQEDAQRFGQGYISTEHLLLGILREDDTAAIRALIRLGIRPTKIRVEIEKHAVNDFTPTGPGTTLTPRAHRIIELGRRYAQELGDDRIGSEHLLLGLVAERYGLAGRILAKFGIQFESAFMAVAIESGSLERRKTSPVGTTEPSPVDGRWSRLDEQARRTLLHAYEASLARDESLIGTSHLLVGLLRDENSLAAQVLVEMGVTPTAIREALDSNTDQSEMGPDEPIGLSFQARKVFDFAAEEAEAMSSSFIGPEHVLLGLIAKQGGIAGLTLSVLGVDVDTAREVIVRLREEA